MCISVWIKHNRSDFMHLVLASSSNPSNCWQTHEENLLLFFRLEYASVLLNSFYPFVSPIGCGPCGHKPTVRKCFILEFERRIIP